MTDKNDKMFPARKSVAQARENQSEDRREQALISDDDLRKDMERQSLQVLDLILVQPPVKLLGYLWVKFHMGLLADLREKDEDRTSTKELIGSFQFAWNMSTLFGAVMLNSSTKKRPSTNQKRRHSLRRSKSLKIRPLCTAW